MTVAIILWRAPNNKENDRQHTKRVLYSTSVQYHTARQPKHKKRYCKIHAFVVLACPPANLLSFAFCICRSEKRSRKEKKKEAVAAAEAAPAVDEEARGKEVAVDHKTKKVRQAHFPCSSLPSC